LPFGLSVAPFIFTKVLRPVVKSLREEDFHSIVYLDDFLLFLLLSASVKECQNNPRINEFSNILRFSIMTSLSSHYHLDAYT